MYNWVSIKWQLIRVNYNQKRIVLKSALTRDLEWRRQEWIVDLCLPRLVKINQLHQIHTTTPVFIQVTISLTLWHLLSEIGKVRLNYTTRLINWYRITLLTSTNNTPKGTSTVFNASLHHHKSLRNKRQ